MWNRKSKVALVKAKITDEHFEEWCSRIDNSTWKPSNCTRLEPYRVTGLYCPYSGHLTVISVGIKTV